MLNSTPQAIKEAQLAFVDEIDGQWGLVTAGSIDDFNTMTIGWGSAGTLWGRPIVTVYVHPWRHTHGYLDESEYFTVQVFGGKHRRDLGILGSKSGRDGDKVALTGLTPIACEHGVTFAEATHTLVCRTVYRHDIDLKVMDQGIREALGDFYAEDAHTAYVGEVVGVL